MKKFGFSRVYILRGGRAARRSCLPGLRHGGGRQAGAAVLSCLVWRCELAFSHASSMLERGRLIRTSAESVGPQNVKPLYDNLASTQQRRFSSGPDSDLDANLWARAFPKRRPTVTLPFAENQSQTLV